MQLYAFVVRKLCPTLDVEGVYGEAVCNHVASQTASLYFGLKETGLELDVMPLPPGPDGAPRRDSLLLMFRLLRDRPQRVHLPDGVRNLASGVYDALGAERVVESGDLVLPGRECVCSSTRIAAAEIARLDVREAGADLDARLDELEGADGSRGVAHVRLDLADRAAPAAAALLARRGYLPCGLLPLWFGSDAFLYQKTPRTPTLDGVKLFSKQAKALAAAILGESA